MENFLALTMVSAALLGSPGPVPIALAGVGASNGVRKGVPFLIGILLGLSIVVIASVAGITALISKSEIIANTLFFFSISYLGYVAWKIANSPINSTTDKSRIPTGRDGFILNLTNPKAYAAISAIVSSFTLSIEPLSLALVITGGVILLVAMIVDAIWLFAGSALSPLFSSAKYGRALRVFFAATMIIVVAIGVWGSKN
ncbi:LysE family translocator [Hyphococcus sp. DH-69]|uniref:LysE family translocator n=1 Tax=Hyphococcus formosus TaxID=3143534 RepID=UPI00398A7E11